MHGLTSNRTPLLVGQSSLSNKDFQGIAVKAMTTLVQREFNGWRPIARSSLAGGVTSLTPARHRTKVGADGTEETHGDNFWIV